MYGVGAQEPVAREANQIVKDIDAQKLCAALTQCKFNTERSSI